MRYAFFCALIVLSSLNSYASSEAFVNINEDFYSVSLKRTPDSKLKLSLKLTKVPLQFSSSDFSFFPTMECVEWATQGTGIDDPGICGKSIQTGWQPHSLLMQAYEVDLIVENLATHKVQKFPAAPVGLNLFRMNNETLPTQALPERDSFEGQVRLPVKNGCLADNILTVGKLAGETLYVSVCAHSDSISIPVDKNGESFSYELPTALDIQYSINAYWRVRDYPHKDMIDKHIEKARGNDLKIPLILPL